MQQTAIAAEANSQGNRTRPRALPLATCLVLVIGAAVLQFSSGAYQADFAADEDEPSHVVSSLMTREYIAHGLFSNPLTFAERYYVHYPKVGVGHWPPLFYCTEALWTLVFGPTRAAFLSLVLFFDALLTLGVYWFAYRHGGPLTGCLAGLAVVASVLMRKAAFTVDPNLMLAVLALAATSAYAGYLETRRGIFATAFAALAIACALTHGRGVLVALIPLIGTLILNRKSIFRPFPLIAILVFGSAVTAAVLLGQSHAITPWTVLRNAVQFPWRIGNAMGWPVLLVAVAGGVRVVRHRDNHLIAMLALLVSTWVLLSVLNSSWGDRYLIVCVPALAVLFGAGCQWLWNLASGARPVRLAAAVMLAIALAVSWARPLAKPDFGFHRLLNQSTMAVPESKISLIAGNSTFEGAFISEMALHDLMPAHVVLRASKVLASSTWSELNYHLRFSSPQQVSAFLDATHTGLLVIQKGYRRPHTVLIAEAIHLQPGTWEEIRGLPEARLFRRAGPMPPGEPAIRINMRDKLGRDLSLDE